MITGGDIKLEEASKIAADFNKKLNEERNNLRKAFFDMQTFRYYYAIYNTHRNVKPILADIT